MASVSIVFRKDKENSKGIIPIHFRIIKNRKITNMSSGLQCKESEWDFEKKKFKNNISKGKETAGRMNGMLYSKFSEIQNEILYLETTQKSVSVKTIRKQVDGEQSASFFEFAQQVLDKYYASGKIGTHDKTKSIIEKLKKYNSSITFEDIDVTFINRYEQYLRSKLKNSTNTIGTNLKFIRTVFNKAFQQGLIEINQNPFLRYKIQNAKTQRMYLTEEELMQIDKLELPVLLKMSKHKDMFVFSAFAGGLRVSDVVQLQWKHYDGERIDFTIKKTGSQLSVKLPTRALEIIRKFDNEQKTKSDFIFGMLPADLDLNNPVEVDKYISNATTLINNSLKSIAKKANIEKNLSFHIARHTWATRALRKGISIDKVSKLMGHSAIKETQIYAKIVNTELDKAMDIFND